LADTKTVLLVKYGEISLRKGNRAYYEHQIMKLMRRKMKDMKSVQVFREQGRFLVEDADGDLDTAAVLGRIKNIFGITGFAKCIKTSARDIHDLREIGLRFFQESAPGAKTFKVETKRSDKTYPMQSGEISASIGERIFDACTGIGVDVHNPEVTLRVEIRNNVYFYVNSTQGVGGLPYGSSGKGVLLLSGGLDSPIAGFLSARRGVELWPLYFHSPPFVSERAADKVRDLTTVLAGYTGRMKLNIVPFTDVQMFLKENVQEAKLTIMLKRAMLRIASMFAASTGAHCIITGDSIGQVASQTMHSIAAVNSAASHTILRPLAAMDKQQIVDIAREIGTFDISIRPYDDCCTLFVAKHPENKPNTAVIERIEASLDSELVPLLEKAFEEIYVEVVSV